jgi:hypothetical protein
LVFISFPSRGVLSAAPCIITITITITIIIIIIVIIIIIIIIIIINSSLLGFGSFSVS